MVRFITCFLLVGLALFGLDAWAEGAASSTSAAPTPAPIAAEPWLGRGVWTDRVPLDLPPGPGGLGPEVALLADPGVREGALGFGWTLSGPSRLERRGPTGGVPGYDAVGSFRLDGQDLYLNTTTGCYEPEQVDGRCIQYDPASNTWTARHNGTTWVYGVVGGAGLAVGLVAGSAPPSSLDETAVWTLASVEDRFGHRVTWAWTTALLRSTVPAGAALEGTPLAWAAQSHPVPARVQWGAAELVFTYEDRPDWRLDAGSGALLVWDRRLVGIEARLGGAPYSAVSVEYAASTRQSVVESVWREGQAGERRRLRALTLADEDEGWDAVGEDLSAQLPYPFTALFDSTVQHSAAAAWNRWSVVNLNGDGRPDLVLVAYACASVDGAVDDEKEAGVADLGVVEGCTVAASAWVNEPSLPVAAGHANGSPPMFVPDVAWTAALGGVFQGSGPGGWALTDLDRDGWTDLVYADAIDGVQLLRYRPWEADFSTEDLNVDPAWIAQGQLGDLDGDGYPDLVVPAQGEQGSVWLRNTGEEGAWFVGALDPFTGFVQGEALLLPLDDAALAADPPAGWPEAGDCGGSEFPRWAEAAYPDAQAYRSAQARLADLNGDGVLDVAYALYTCWAPYSALDGGEVPEAGSEFSRVFYGDGRGGFYDSGLGAGEPWLVAVEPGGISGFNHHSNTHMQVLDVDRSGSLALLQYAGTDTDGAVVVLGGYDAGLLRGWFPEGGADPWPADFDPGISALGGRYPHESQVLFADFDGDGFPDQLRLSADREDEHDVQEAPTWSARWHDNTRSSTQGRMLAVEGPWGGSTALTWGFTANRAGNQGGVEPGVWALEDEDAPNRWLHTNQEILVAQDGAEGVVQYRYLHGFHDGGRFRGFGVVERRDAAGRTEHGFGVSPPLGGAGLYVARYRADDTLEQAVVNLHLTTGVLSATLPGADSWGLDVEAPYFNPMTRQCSAEVGSAGAVGLEDLVAACLVFDRVSPDTPDPAEWAVAAGWAVSGALAGWVWEGDPSEDAGVISFGGWGEPPAALGFSAGPGGATLTDERVTAVDPNWTLPERPAAPTPEGDPGWVMHATSWSYFENGQLAWVGQHRDIRTTDDDLETRYTWSAQDPDAWGYALERTRTTDASGAQLEELVRADLLPGAFDLPQTLTRCGRGSSACVTVTQTWTDAAGTLPGQPTAQGYPDGTAETWTYDPSCGLPTRHEDRVGRVTRTRYDALCRREQVLSEGAQTTWTYDGLHRVVGETLDPNVGDGLSHDTVERWSIYDEDLGNMPLNGLSVPAHKAVVSGAGRVDWLSVDGWGREVYTASCPGARAGSGAVCSGSVRLAGQLRLESGRVGWQLLPHFDGEEAAQLLAFTHDARGRVVASSAPSSTEDGARAETQHRYEPDHTVTVGPLGVASERWFDTLGEERWRAGVFRGSLERDAWGLPLRETDAAGVVRELAYDELHRLSMERLTWDATLSPSTDDGCVSAGATAPESTACAREWQHAYDVIARTHTVTDPEGVVVVSTYDAADRLTRQTVAGVMVLRGAHRPWSASGPATTTLTDEAGAEVVLTLDGWGRVISREDPAGLTEHIYGPDGLERQGVDPNGRGLLWERDAWGQVTAACWPSGWDAATATCTTPLIATTYDGGGRPQWTQDADGVQTEAIWSPAGQLLERWQGPYRLESHTYDLAGRVRSSTVNGVERTTTWDDLDRPILEEFGGETWTRWTWNDGDQPIASAVGPVDGAEAETIYSYNALGELSAITHPGPTAPTERRYHDALGRLRFHETAVGGLARLEYDAQGRVIFTSEPGLGEQTYRYTAGLRWDGTDALTRIRVTDGEGQQTDRYLDSLGRLQGEVRPDSTVFREVYEGLDPTGTLHYGTDGALLAAQSRVFESETGRPSTQYGWFFSPDGTPTPADYTVRRTWTPAGRLAELDAGGEATTFTYEHGLPATESWDAGVQHRAYGRSAPDPRVISETWTGSDGVSQRLRTLTHDAAGRRIAESIEDTWTGQTLTTTWSDLDAYGNPHEVVRSLNGTEVSAEQWSYTPLGWPATRETWVEGTSIGVMSWTWADDGALQSQTTPSGRTLRHVRTLQGDHPLLTRLEVDGRTVVEVSTRDGNLRPTRLTLRAASGGSQQLGLRYDAMGRVEEKWASAGLGAQAITWEAAYDERGRLVEEVTTDADGVHASSYAYTEPGWLSAEAHTRGGAWSAEYLHDAAGNRTERWTDGVQDQALTWDGSVLASVNTDTPLYDPFDAVEDDGLFFYTHDPDGELTAIEDADGLLYRLQRDPEGRPVLTEDAEGVTWSHFDLGHGALPLETEGPEGTVLELVVEGLRLGQLRDGATKPLPLFTDPRGTVLQHGAERLPAFGAFGDRVQAPTTGERHLYAGLTSLPDAPELLLAQHRAVHPATGRFLSPDPLGLAGGLHRSRYAEGDPVGYTDPTGWTAQPTTLGAQASVHDQPAPSTGDSAPHRDPSGGGTLCAATPFACAGNQAGDRKWERRFVMSHADSAPDEEEEDASIDAESAARSAEGSAIDLQFQGTCTDSGCSAAHSPDPDGGARRHFTMRFRDGDGEGGDGDTGPEGDGDEEQALGSGEGSEGAGAGASRSPESPGPRTGGQMFSGDLLRRGFEELAKLRSTVEAYYNGQASAALWYTADTLSTLPDLAALVGGPVSGVVSQRGIQSFYDQTGLLTDMRGLANERYLAGHRMDPAATLAGSNVGMVVMATADVLVPGPGFETKLAVRATERGQELVQLGATALVRKVDDNPQTTLRYLTNFGTGRFAPNQAIPHFERHAGQVQNTLGKRLYTLGHYIDDANTVIRTGTWVPEMSGYVKIVGGPGSAKALFAGLDRTTGNITTFHVKTVRELARKAPSLGWHL